MKSKIATLAASPALILAALLITQPAHASGFGITDLVTDDNTNLTSLGLPAAANTDPNLVNPWGISFNAGSPFWISDNHTGVSTLYNAAGVPQSLVVTVAPPIAVPLPPGAVSAPTGTVFNNHTSGATIDFVVSSGGVSGGANFLFDTEDGVISGRSGAVGGGTQSFIGVDNSASGAVYKGLAIAPGAGGHNVIFATNFNSGMVEEYNSTWGQVKTFTDPSLPPVPAGTPPGQNWAPFNAQVLNGQLYVTYALQDSLKHDDVAGAGNGFVDVFDTNGNFIKRVVNVGGQLDSPWGLAIAPAGFGSFANDLLVGNFGDGEIDAFNLTTDSFVGVLTDENGTPIDIPGLWALTVRNGVNGFNPNAIYFTAGLPLFSDPDRVNEQAGVFGLLVSIPEPSTLALLLAGLVGMFWYGRKRVAPEIAG